MSKLITYIRCEDCKNIFHNSEKGLYYYVKQNIELYYCVFCNGKYEFAEFTPLKSKLEKFTDKIKKIIKYA